MDTVTETWVNDYLDLYNYARSIGDSEWETELLETLRKKEGLREYRKAVLLRELWSTYRRVNEQLTEVFTDMRNTADRKQTEILQEKWYNLKVKRMAIARKIMETK